MYVSMSDVTASSLSAYIAPGSYLISNTTQDKADVEKKWLLWVVHATKSKTPPPQKTKQNVHTYKVNLTTYLWQLLNRGRTYLFCVCIFTRLGGLYFFYLKLQSGPRSPPQFVCAPPLCFEVTPNLVFKTHAKYAWQIRYHSRIRILTSCSANSNSNSVITLIYKNEG